MAFNLGVHFAGSPDTKWKEDCGNLSHLVVFLVAMARIPPEWLALWRDYIALRI